MNLKNLSKKNKIIIIVTILVIISVIIVATVLLTRKSNNNNMKKKENNISINETIEEIEQEEVKTNSKFEPKVFENEEKYRELYNIVKGSTETINGIEFSYKSGAIVNSIGNAIESNSLKELPLQDKLNLIYSKIDGNKVTKDYLKEIFKKYYNTEELGDYTNDLYLYSGTEGRQQIIFDEEGQKEDTPVYGVANVSVDVDTGKKTDTTTRTLGILDEVEDHGDIIILKEKFFKISYMNNSYWIESIWSFNTEVNDINEIDIASFYDKLYSYEYYFKRNGEDFYLNDIKIKIYNIEGKTNENNEDIVYTAIKSTAMFQPNEVHQAIPKINLNSKDVNEINKEIEEMIEGEDTYINYKYYLNDNILSLIIEQSPGYDYSNFIVYNININTGKKLTNEELLKTKQISVTEFENNLPKIFGKIFEEYYLQMDKEDELYKEQYNRTISKENCTINNQIFLGETGEINIIGTIYSLAGAESYQHIIKYK